MSTNGRCATCGAPLRQGCIQSVCERCLLEAVMRPRAQEIRAELLQIESARERTAFVQEVCSDDPELRDQLLGWLKDLGEVAPKRPPKASPAPGDGLIINDRYRLIQEIGEGGFGTVYLAQQLRPIQRRVALKVLKLGMDTRQVVARFELERQALALMDHPHIAKVFDAGATDAGRPFFVMELVRGMPIIEFCEQQGLSLRQRLELFVLVCHAVQHAHQKGIIHRDLKPSNILVASHAGTPEPKVIDFGIAKATQARFENGTVLTQEHLLLGTPAYISPEQAAMAGADIDTRTDIYSLGVLLYELLTGSTPFDSRELVEAGLDEMRRIIREKQPPRPSTRSRQTRASDRPPAPNSPTVRTQISPIDPDLDWIVLACLQKDRSRRYATANGLAMEVRRYLAHQPILARPPSRLYGLSKWVRRNRVVAALAALLVVAVISAIVIGAMMGFRIRQANQRLSETVRYLESQTYEELAAKGQPAPLLAWLASRMRQDPFDSGAASRAISVLSLRNFVLPDGPPLVHPAQVNDAQFSPDGAQIMTGCEDGAVRFWDTATRRLLRAIPHTAGVMEASYLAGGTRILVTTRDNVARVYDTATHALLCEVGHLQTQPLAPVESGDGGWLYAAHRDLTVSRWDLRSGQRLVPTIQVGTRVERLRRSNRGSCVAIGCADGAVLLIDAATGQPLHPARHFEAIDNLFFTPDGRRLLIPLQKGARVARWDFGGMDQVSEVIPSNPEPMLTMTASPDGRRLFTSAWGAPLRILDAETLERVATTVGQPTQGGAVYSLSHDGSRVAGFTQDGVALIWDSRTARPLFERFEHQGWIRRLEFSPDDTHVLTASDDGTARLWDVRMHLPPPVSLPAVRSGGEAVFNHAGTRLVVGVEENTFQVCDGRTGQPVGPPLKIPERARIRMNAFSPDDTKVLAVVIGKEGIIRVWEATTLQPGLVLALGRGVNVAEFSRDGRSIVAGDRAGYATVWDAGTGKQTGVISDYNQEVVALDLHPKGGAFLTAGVNGTARCWTLPTAQPASPPFKHRGIVWDARYSPEGDRVVTASADHTAQVWDARTGRPLTKPMSHEKGVYSARFSPNGECVLTTSEDGTARVWSARTGDPLSSSLRHGAQVWMGAFGPDSRLVATGSGDHTARLWDGRSGLPVSEPLAHPGEVSRLSFDPLGQRLLTLGGAAQLWDVLVAPAPVPPWFCDLVEAVAGTRLASDGQVLPVSPEVFEALRKRWAAPNQTDFYARWAHWFLNDRQHDPAPRFLPR